MFGRRVEIADHISLQTYLLEKCEPRLRKIFLRDFPGRPLENLTRFQCVLTTKVLAQWIENETKGVEALFAFRGSGNFGRAINHEILGCQTNQGFSYADGTIWQFRPNSKRMHIAGSWLTEAQMAFAVAKDYGGKWYHWRDPYKFNLDVKETINGLRLSIQNEMGRKI